MKEHLNWFAQNPEWKVIEDTHTQNPTKNPKSPQKENPHRIPHPNQNQSHHPPQTKKDIPEVLYYLALLTITSTFSIFNKQFKSSIFGFKLLL